MQIDTFSKLSYGYGTVTGDVTPMERRDELLSGLSFNRSNCGPCRKIFRHKKRIIGSPVKKVFHPNSPRFVISPIERPGVIYNPPLNGVDGLGMRFKGRGPKAKGWRRGKQKTVKKRVRKGSRGGARSGLVRSTMPVARVVDSPLIRKGQPVFSSQRPTFFIPEEVFIGQYDDDQLGKFKFKKFLKKLVKPLKKIAAHTPGTTENKKYKIKKKIKGVNAEINAATTPEAKKAAYERLAFFQGKLKKARSTQKKLAIVAAMVVGAVFAGPAILSAAKTLGAGIGKVGSLAFKGAKLVVSGAMSGGLKKKGVPPEVADAVGAQVAEETAQNGGVPPTESRVSDLVEAAAIAYQSRQGNAGVENAAFQEQYRQDSGRGPVTFGPDASEVLEEQDAAAETNKWLIPALVGGGVLITGLMLRKR